MRVNNNLLKYPSYGDEFGPDLPELLKHLKLKLSDFIQLHTGANYFVSMMGYSPGFPYLTGMHKSYMLIIRVNTKIYPSWFSHS